MGQELRVHRVNSSPFNSNLPSCTMTRFSCYSKLDSATLAGPHRVITLSCFLFDGFVSRFLICLFSSLTLWEICNSNQHFEVVPTSFAIASDACFFLAFTASRYLKLCVRPWLLLNFTSLALPWSPRISVSQPCWHHVLVFRFSWWRCRILG